MNTNKESKGFSLLRILFIIAICAAIAWVGTETKPLHAQAPDTQGQASAIYAPTNQPATLAANTTASLSNVITLRKGQGLGIAWTFTGSTNAQLLVRESIDGTNYPPLPTFVFLQTNLLAAVNGGGFAELLTNLQPAQLAGIATISITMSNLGSIILTNGPSSNGLVINRPN